MITLGSRLDPNTHWTALRKGDSPALHPKLRAGALETSGLYAQPARRAPKTSLEPLLEAWNQKTSFAKLSKRLRASKGYDSELRSRTGSLAPTQNDLSQSLLEP